MSEIINIVDPRVLAIKIVESNEPLIDVKTTNELQYGPVPECDLSKNCYTKVRKTVFEKIIAAQKDLPHGWLLRLYEGYRSLEVQKLLYDQMFAKTRAANPSLADDDVFHLTTNLVSPVINLDGSVNIPAHNTGGAIDIEIITEDGAQVDMGMGAVDWVSVQPELCCTFSKLPDKAAQRNRMILFEVMQAHGFVNYQTEWWHYSYGDRYWAYHQNKPHAIYGGADFLVRAQ